MMIEGGAAFPRSNGNGNTMPQNGMSLRDYFAAQALPAVLAVMHDAVKLGVMQNHPTDEPTVAKACYEVADAMLIEREK